MNTPNTPRIALIGECMIELQHRADGSLQQSFGGDTLNTAVYLARELGERGAVDYVTALGDDSFSDAMCRSWAEENIGLDRVQRLPGRGLLALPQTHLGRRRAHADEPSQGVTHFPMSKLAQWASWADSCMRQSFEEVAHGRRPRRRGPPSAAHRPA